MEVRQKASLSRQNIFADKRQQNLQQAIQEHIECESAQKTPLALQKSIFEEHLTHISLSREDLYLRNELTWT